MNTIRAALQETLRTSMRMRDRDAMSVLRSALAAIDNAEAVPLEDSATAGALEGSPVGVGVADAPRRELSEADMVRLVKDEIDELGRAASLTQTTSPEGAARLRAQAEVLTVVLAHSGH